MALGDFLGNKLSFRVENGNLPIPSALRPRIKIFVMSPTGSLPTLDAHKDEDEGHQALEFWAPTSAFSGDSRPMVSAGELFKQ